MTEHKPAETGTERAGDAHDHKRTDGGPDSAVAPFPPDRPVDDQRPVSQKEGEARATAAALAGEHGSDGPPQYVDAPEPRGHNAGDYEIPGEPHKGSAAKKAADREKASDQKAADQKAADRETADQKVADQRAADQRAAGDKGAKEGWRDQGSAASR